MSGTPLPWITVIKNLAYNYASLPLVLVWYVYPFLLGEVFYFSWFRQLNTCKAHLHTKKRSKDIQKPAGKKIYIFTHNKEELIMDTVTLPY